LYDISIGVYSVYFFFAVIRCMASLFTYITSEDIISSENSEVCVFILIISDPGTFSISSMSICIGVCTFFLCFLVYITT